MIRKLATYLLFIFAVATLHAQDVRFEMAAPNAVEMGKQFRITFTTYNKQGNNLKLPPGLADNFEILMGPTTGSSTQISNINGQSTVVRSFYETYILRAKKEGSFEIRPASIIVDGDVMESNSLNIQVVKAQSQAQTQPAQPQSNSSSGSAQNVNIGDDDLFVRLELSKTNAYKGEQILATVKLYVNPNIPVAGFDEVNLPSYEGFFTQDIEIPQQVNFNREVYNSKIYQVGVLKKTILFPQQNGKITIQPFNMTLLVQQQVQARSFFDDFFNSYRTVRSSITSKPVSVNIKDLPAAPSTFMGGVGNFNISSGISSQDVTTNDAVTLKLTVTGTGNIRLIRTPELKLPSDFEVYDPKTNENVKTTDSGTSGTKTFEYLFQPRFEGDYTIPAITFTYFNPASGSYETKSTSPYELHVKKGSAEQSATVVSSLRKEDVQLLGKDIRFIKQGDISLRIKGHTFFGSPGFYLIYAVSAILFLVLFFVAIRNVIVHLLSNDVLLDVSGHERLARRSRRGLTATAATVASGSGATTGRSRPPATTVTAHVAASSGMTQPGGSSGTLVAGPGVIWRLSASENEACELCTSTLVRDEGRAGVHAPPTNMIVVRIVSPVTYDARAGISTSGSGGETSVELVRGPMVGRQRGQRYQRALKIQSRVWLGSPAQFTGAMLSRTDENAEKYCIEYLMPFRSVSPSSPLNSGWSMSRPSSARSSRRSGPVRSGSATFMAIPHEAIANWSLSLSPDGSATRTIDLIRPSSLVVPWSVISGASAVSKDPRGNALRIRRLSAPKSSANRFHSTTNRDGCSWNALTGGSSLLVAVTSTAVTSSPSSPAKNRFHAIAPSTTTAATTTTAPNKGDLRKMRPGISNFAGR